MKSQAKAQASRGRPPEEYIPKDAKFVQTMAQYGVPHEDIAATLEMCVETMQRLYSRELMKGRGITSTQIGKRLFEKAMDGDTAALIFWAKTRMGWKETCKIEPVTKGNGADVQRDFETALAIYRGDA